MWWVLLSFLIRVLYRKELGLMFLVIVCWKMCIVLEVLLKVLVDFLRVVMYRLKVFVDGVVFIFRSF